MIELDKLAEQVDEKGAIAHVIEDAMRMGAAIGSWDRSDREWHNRPGAAALEGARHVFTDMLHELLTLVREREAAETKKA